MAGPLPDRSRLFLLAACLLGGLGVALGAFGAHGLKKMLDPRLLEVYETAVLYQFLHAFALLAVGLWIRQTGASRPLNLAGLLWIGGIVLFSGSLYLYVLSGIHMLAFVTPFGGMLLILGWIAAGWAAWQRPATR
ncbi:MAG: DUF423 domain-containing protein [Halothiobacillaceae bacterium]|nr:MAG: DUF423 domain-containing protein [Halothiobacillaceae bacterium]